jgi:hypothetical protein
MALPLFSTGATVRLQHDNRQTLERARPEATCKFDHNRPPLDRACADFSETSEMNAVKFSGVFSAFSKLLRRGAPVPGAFAIACSLAGLACVAPEQKSFERLGLLQDLRVTCSTLDRTLWLPAQQWRSKSCEKTHSTDASFSIHRMATSTSAMEVEIAND